MEGRIRQAPIIRETYGEIQSDGVAVAEALYDPDELTRLPRGAVELALGVGHPVRHADLKAGEVVLDLGCGPGSTPSWPR